MTDKLKSLVVNEYFVMAVVIAMYLVKAFVKISLGHSMGLPAIESDGYHNAADIIEAAVVIVVMYVSMLPANREYPFGRRNLEFFASLVIGAVLICLSFSFAIQSIIGLVAQAPALDATIRSVISLPAYTPIAADASRPLAMAVVAISALFSIAVSRYQITIGKRTGRDSLIADGKETQTDGLAEWACLAGLVIDTLLHAAWVEYAAGLLVAWFILQTGWELFDKAISVLQQRSIGLAHEDQIKTLCLSVPGIEAIRDIKTFQVGQLAVVKLTLETWHNMATRANIAIEIRRLVSQYITEEFQALELQLEFTEPVTTRLRAVLALKRIATDMGTMLIIADTFAEATSIEIGDIENGSITRCWQENNPPTSPAQLEQFVKDRHVDVLCSFDAEAQKELLDAAGIELDASLIAVCHPNPAVVLGFTPRTEVLLKQPVPV